MRRWPLIRDVAAFLIGSFMLVEQTVSEIIFGIAPNPILVGAGLAAWGVTASGIVLRKINEGS